MCHAGPMPQPAMTPLPSGKITLRDARRGTTRDVDLEPFEIATHPLHDPGTGVEMQRRLHKRAGMLHTGLGA